MKTLRPLAGLLLPALAFLVFPIPTIAASATATLHGELDAGVPYEALEVLVLLRVEMFGVLELLLAQRFAQSELADAGNFAGVEVIQGFEDGELAFFQSMAQDVAVAEQILGALVNVLRYGGANQAVVTIKQMKNTSTLSLVRK